MSTSRFKSKLSLIHMLQNVGRARDAEYVLKPILEDLRFHPKTVTFLVDRAIAEGTMYVACP